MDRPAYDPNAQRLERQNQEPRSKFTQKRTENDKKKQSIAMRKNEHIYES